MILRTTILLVSLAFSCSTSITFAKEKFTRLASGRPVTGKQVPGGEIFDAAMDDFMESIDCQAGTIAVTFRGKLIYARGYGWMDKENTLPTQPETTMRIASCAKPITSAIVKTLIRRRALRPDLRVFPYLAITPEGRPIADERVGQITVDHLLKHLGGFDSVESFDPMFRIKTVEKELELTEPASSKNVIEYMLTQRLQFNPGERSAYSNYGYCVLGRVIEQATKKSYIDAVDQVICRPLGIRDLSVSRSSAADRPDSEAWYPVKDTAFSIEVMDAHGGLTTSSVSLCKFMQAYWISGEPRKPGGRYSYAFFGSLPGTTAMMQQRTDGIDCAVLLNARRNGQSKQDNARLRESINGAIDRLKVFRQ